MSLGYFIYLIYWLPVRNSLVFIMATITFDALKFANTLKEAGVPAAQAEAEATALSEV